MYRDTTSNKMHMGLLVKIENIQQIILQKMLLKIGLSKVIVGIILIFIWKNNITLI